LCYAAQAAVAVRSAPGSSLLKDVATLHAGDTFGESCLLVGGTGLLKGTALLGACCHFFISPLSCRILPCCAKQGPVHQTVHLVCNLCGLVDGSSLRGVDSACLHTELTCCCVVQNKQRHPAFVVVRSAVLIGLTVNAQALATALPAALKQV
jgi:hypothetical protein